MAVAPSAQHHDNFWADTFQERGAVVPFTTPVLAFSRVRRQEEERLELLVPGLAGGRDTYVIPWRSLPSVFAMTVHDRALREEIEALPESRPDEIREATLKVESTGLAGVAGARAARRASNDDENERLLTNFFLVSESVRQLSGGKLQLGPAELANSAGQAHVKLMLSRIAALFQLSVDEFYGRLEAWAGSIAPLGAPGLNYICRQRQLMVDLNDFSADLEAWAERDFTDASESARVCAAIAQETASSARTMASGVDRYAADMRGTLNEWTASFARIDALMEKLNWTLDGWRHVVTMWGDVDKADREAAQDTVGEMLRHMPVVPRRELGSRARKTWGDLSQKLQRTRIRAGEDWLSGKVDIELVLRLERFKAKSHDRA